MFSEFIKDPLKTYYDGEDEDEKILYVLRASVITTLPWIVLTAVLALTPFIFIPIVTSITQDGVPVVNMGFLGIFTLFWYLFTIGYFFQCFINWFFNAYIITTKKILDFDFKGLLYKNISETTLDNVQDITSNVTGSLNVIFNIGNVKIQTAGERIEFEFENVYHPAQVRDIIADLVVKVKHGDNLANNN